MKKTVCFVLLFAGVSLFAQTAAKVDDPKKTDTTDKKTDTSISDSVTAPWGSTFDKVKKSIRGTLKYYKKNHYIISKDGEITYTYGFFFADPELTGEEKSTTSAEPTKEPAATPVVPATTEKPAEEGEAKFSHVVVRFPYLAMDDVRVKMVAKFGEPTAESIVKNRGVIVWETDTTIRTLWVDSYEKQPYCRKIVMVSKEISKQLKDYHYKIFNRKEIETLEKLKP